MTTTYMPFFTGDYLKNTMHLSAEEHGAYMLMMIHCWHHDKIENDEKIIKNIAKISSKKLRRVLPFFEVFEGCLIHQTVNRIKAEAIDNKDKLSTRGKAGAEARWGKTDASSNAQALLEQSPSPSPSSSIKNAAASKLVFSGQVLEVTEKRFKEFESLFPGMNLVEALKDADQFYLRLDDGYANIDARLKGTLLKSYHEHLDKLEKEKAKVVTREESQKIQQQQQQDKTDKKKKEDDEAKELERQFKEQLAQITKEISARAATGDIDGMMHLAALQINPNRYMSFMPGMKFIRDGNVLNLQFSSPEQEYGVNIFYLEPLRRVAERHSLTLNYKVNAG